MAHQSTLRLTHFLVSTGIVRVATAKRAVPSVALVRRAFRSRNRMGSATPKTPSHSRFCCVSAPKARRVERRQRPRSSQPRKSNRASGRKSIATHLASHRCRHSVLRYRQAVPSSKSPADSITRSPCARTATYLPSAATSTVNWALAICCRTPVPSK